MGFTTPDWVTALVSGVSGVGLTLLGLRRYLSGEKVALAANDAAAGVIKALNEQVAIERARADHERQRANLERDRAEKMLAQIGELRQEVHMLSSEVVKLRAQVAVYMPSATP